MKLKIKHHRQKKELISNEVLLGSIVLTLLMIVTYLFLLIR